MPPYNHRGREPRPNRLEIRLSDAELMRLEQMCIEQDRNASAIVRSALERYATGVENDEKTHGSQSQEPAGYRPAP